MLLRNTTLDKIIEQLETARDKHTAAFKQLNKEEEAKTINFPFYDKAIDPLKKIRKSLITLFNNMNELISNSKNSTLKQKAILNLIGAHQDKISACFEQYSVKLDFNIFHHAIKELTQSGLILEPINSEQYEIDDITARSTEIIKWMTTQIDYFKSIDILIQNFEHYRNIFIIFFETYPEIANQRMIKSITNTRENSRDAVLFQQILNEPLQFSGHLNLFLQTMQKQNTVLMTELKGLNADFFDIYFRSKLSESQLEAEFLKTANNKAEQLEKVLTSSQNKIYRFNKRQEVDGASHHKSDIRFDLTQSCILQPTLKRISDYSACCEFYKSKFKRFSQYMQAYEARCSDKMYDIFLAKHNKNGKNASQETRGIWEKEYDDAYERVQKSLKKTIDFIPPFITELKVLNYRTINLLQDYPTKKG